MGEGASHLKQVRFSLLAMAQRAEELTFLNFTLEGLTVTDSPITGDREELSAPINVVELQPISGGTLSAFSALSSNEVIHECAISLR
jgi:hypothetical protein